MGWIWDSLTSKLGGEHEKFAKYTREGEMIERTGPTASGGPKGLGDPFDRSLNKQEEDPLIPQRKMDIARTVLCREVAKEYDDCVFREGGIMMWFRCLETRDATSDCLKNNFWDPEFEAAVTEEYLNERSHYRTTGIRQRRYMAGKFLKRNTKTDPALDNEGKYRPQKPLGWDESYPDGAPEWASFKYDL